jgi:hypothetical protein
MAKFLIDAAMDAELDFIAAQAERMVVCSSQPANYAAVAAATLADVALDAGDFSKANGDTSGRKLTVAAQNDLLIDASGTANHVALVRDSAGGSLVLVTTCTAQALVANGTNTVNVPAFDHEIGDPT